MRTFIIAEIGINHNGSLELAKKLIDVAVDAGASAVKFQKRDIGICYTPQELMQARESPFGSTNGELKRALELSYGDYEAIDAYCKEKGIIWFASPWDLLSVNFLERFNIAMYKIPSSRNTDISLMKYVASKGKPTILSTGMATETEIEQATRIFDRNVLVLMVCTATYPAKLEELNLSRIWKLDNKYPQCVIGYSGHEVGLYSSLCAVAMGATYLERHITLDRSSFGSDQSASIEPEGFRKLVREIRDFEIALGCPEFRMLESEKPIALKLRRP